MKTAMTIRAGAALTTSTIVLGLAAVAQGALPDDLRCQIGKLKAVSSYTSCRLKADATGLQKNLTPDFTNCVEKFNTKFPRLEEVAGVGVCPSENDLGDIRDRSDDFETAINVLLSGGTLPAPACGDGTIDLGEDCEVGELGGETCETQGFFNGTLHCGPGCSFDTTECNADRWVDTGTTIIDNQTGLEWEKKDSSDGIVNAANAHDVDNTYTWAASGSSTNTTMTGTLYTDFLTKMNGTTNTMTVVTSGCYANHCDWRIPIIDELKTINPIDAAFSPNKNARYWSNTTRAGLPTGAYFLDFSTGAASPDVKTALYHARAVRSIR
jgi:hypothetical protein